MGRSSDNPYHHPSPPFLDGLQVVIPSERESTHNVWRPSFGCSPSLAIEDDDVKLGELERHTEECVYGRAFYRTWRSWKFPVSPNTTNTTNRKKCLMDACDDQFQDLDSAFTHINECKVLKSHAERMSSPTQSSLLPTPAAPAVAHSDPSPSRCSHCHSTRRWAKSFCLRRIKSFHDGLMRRRKSTPLPNATADGITELPSDSWSANCPPPSYCFESQSLADIRGIHHTIDSNKSQTAQEASELDVATYRFEMDTTTDRFELASGPAYNDSSSVTTCDLRDEISDSLSSEMSEPKSFCRGQHSPGSVYSPSSGASSSTTSLPQPICPTIIQVQGPSFEGTQTYDSAETDEGDYPTSLLTDGSLPTVGVRSPSGIPFDLRPQCPLSHFEVPVPFQNCSEINHLQVTVLEAPVLATTTATMPRSDSLSSPPLAFLSRETSVYPNQRFIETLESLKATLSNLRKSKEIYGTDPICATSLSQVSDEAVLHGALSTLETLLQGSDDGVDVFKLCFAHLALAMAIELRGIIMPDIYEALYGDFRQMVGSEGGAGSTGRFLHIASLFLEGLKPENSRRNGLQNQTGEESITEVVNLNFKAMRDYFMGCSLSPTQESPDSTTGSVLDPGTNRVGFRGEAHMLLPFRQEPCQSTRSISVNLDTTSHIVPQVPQNLDTLTHRSLRYYGPLLRNGSMVPSTPLVATVDSGGRRRVGKRAKTVQEKRKNRTPLETCCSPCGFYPSSGPGQQKKLARHKDTLKHNGIISRISEHLEVKTESATPPAGPEETPSKLRGTDITLSADITTGRRGKRVFQCPLQRVDGSPCPQTFTRRDNMKSHTIKIKHRDVSS